MDESWEGFKHLLFTAADECIPKVRLQQKKRRNWLTDETLGLTRKKKRGYSCPNVQGKQRTCAATETSVMVSEIIPEWIAVCTLSNFHRT